MICRCFDAWLGFVSELVWIAPGLSVTGTVLQLIGSIMTLWSLLSAPRTLRQRLRAFVGALWRSQGSRVAAELADLNPPRAARVLQGVAFLALGYLLDLASKIWPWVVG
jgi:hypothetical protein